MDLGSVRVKIEGDSTKLQADLKAAEAAAANAGGKIAEAFNKSAGNIKDAQNAVKAATLNMAEAAKAFGPAAATGNKAAVSSLKLYETELKTAQAELARFTKQQATSATSASKPPSFVGAIPGFGVAAERFIGMVPGLGGTLTSLFPLFGATAFLAVIDRIAPKILEAAEAFDPMTRATERAKKAAEDYDDVIQKLKVDIKELNADAIEFAVGKSAAGAIGSAEKTQEQRASQGMVKLLKDELAQYEAIAKAKLAAANAPANPYDEGGGQLLVAAKESKAANLDVETARKRLTAFEAQAAKDEAEASQKIRKSLVQGVDDRKKASADLDQLVEKEKRRKQKEEDEEDRNAAKREKRIDELVAAQKLIIDSERKFNHAMDEQKQSWKKITIDAKDQRVTQSKIEAPVASRIAGPLAGALELRDAGIQTTQMRQEQIAEDQRLLNMAELMNVPLGTQLQLREEILQKQIDLKAAQGQSVSAELQALDALQAQMDQMRQKSAGIAPMLHNLREIGGQIPGQLGEALAGGIMSGNPGKAIGQEIRGALQGIGQQLLGTVFQAAIQQLIVSLGLNTLANTVLQALFPVQQGTTAGLIAALGLNTAAVSAQAASGAVGAGVGAAGKVAGIAGSLGSAASGGLLGSVISGAISAAGSLVSAFLIIRAIHGTTAEVRALRRSGGIKPGSGGISGADAEKPAQTGYMSSLAKIFGADAIRVNIVAISPLVITNGLISVLGNLFGFANGGRPPTGRPSIVGERGPEMFIPDQAGRIVPNHMLNGGAGLSFPSASSSSGGINIGSITANGVNNPREFVREVARQLPAYLKSTNPKYSPASR